jgi:hypothetical protein
MRSCLTAVIFFLFGFAITANLAILMILLLSPSGDSMIQKRDAIMRLLIRPSMEIR